MITDNLLTQFGYRFKCEPRKVDFGYINQDATVGLCENIPTIFEIGDKTVIENVKTTRTKLGKLKTESVNINGALFNAKLIRKVLFLTNGAKTTEFYQGGLVSIPKNEWDRRNLVTILPLEGAFIVVAPRVTDDESTFHAATRIEELKTEI